MRTPFFYYANRIVVFFSEKGKVWFVNGTILLGLVFECYVNGFCDFICGQPVANWDLATWRSFCSIFYALQNSIKAI